MKQSLWSDKHQQLRVGMICNVCVVSLELLWINSVYFIHIDAANWPSTEIMHTNKKLFTLMADGLVNYKLWCF
jgi:hypothetical protein